MMHRAPVISAAPRAIPPPPKINPNCLTPTLIQPTQILPPPPDRSRPHQSLRERERRRKQLDRQKGR